MTHPLEVEYGLTASEILEGISRRFRAKVAVEGVVAEMQMDRILRSLKAEGAISAYETHDIDGMHDFSLQVPTHNISLRIEVKNVRDRDEAFRTKGQIVAYKVEVQKTRAATGDPTSILYGIDQFDILAVCLGKKTGNWTDFRFISARDLARHRDYPQKLAVIHRVPLPGAATPAPWYDTLEALLQAW